MSKASGMRAVKFDVAEAALAEARNQTVEITLEEMARRCIKCGRGCQKQPDGRWWCFCGRWC